MRRLACRPACRERARTARSASAGRHSGVAHRRTFSQVLTRGALTVLGHFRHRRNALRWRPPPRLGQSPLRARVKSTQARNGMCPARTGRAHASNKRRFAESFSQRPADTFRSRLFKKPIFLSETGDPRPNAPPICRSAVGLAGDCCFRSLRWLRADAQGVVDAVQDSRSLTRLPLVSTSYVFASTPRRTKSGMICRQLSMYSKSSPDGD